MALTDIERRIVDQLKSDGYNDNDIIAHIGAQRSGRTSQIDQAVVRENQLREDSQQRGTFELNDITDTLRETGEALSQRVKDVQAAVDAPSRRFRETIEAGGSKSEGIAAGIFKGVPEAAFTAAPQFAGAAGDILAAPLMAYGRASFTEEQEAQIGAKFQDLVSPLTEKMPESEEGQRAVRAGFSYFDLLGLGLFGKAQRALTRPLSKAVDPVKFVDDVAERVEENLVRQVSETPGVTARQIEEASQQALTIKERLIGLQPDVKKRLAEFGEEGVGEYLNATRLRNASDRPIDGLETGLPDGVWGPQELGNHYVNEAAEIMTRQLRETGGEIGTVRKKLGTVPLPQNAVDSIEKSFLDELGKLNLEVRNGQVRLQPGKVSRVSGNGDINAIQGLYDELRVFKQSPNFQNAIDLRMSFDQKVKFGKSSQEVSNSVDPLSRSVRSQIANDTAKFIGSENADALAKYSDFMEAYGDLTSYTDRAAGSEYLLRVALSGRGREARELMDTIADQTGIDLMNHATAMKVAVDTLGNTNQQNLFAQEVARAVGDIGTLSSGGFGAAGVIVRRLAEKGIDAETVIRNAAAGTIGAGTIVLLVENPEIIDGLFDLSADNPAATMGIIGMIGASKGKLPQSTINRGVKEIDLLIADARKVATNPTSSSAQIRAAEKTVNQLTLQKADLLDSGKAQSATTKTTDLLEEAKKYDSAEEFVEAQTKGTVIHGTNKPIEGKLKLNSKVEGVMEPDDAAIDVLFVTPNTQTGVTHSRMYTKQDGQVYTLKISEEAKIFDYSNPEHRRLLEDQLSESERNLIENNLIDGQLYWAAIPSPKKVKALGFDGMKQVERKAGDEAFDEKFGTTNYKENAESIMLWNKNAFEQVDLPSRAELEKIWKESRQ